MRYSKNEVELNRFAQKKIGFNTYKTIYTFEITIFNLNLFRELAIDSSTKNLLKITSKENLNDIFGDFDYFDDGFKLGVKGHICLKREDSFHYEKFEFFEIEVIKAFQLLGYSENSDFEITLLSWVERDIHSTLEYRSTYLCVDTTPIYIDFRQNG